MAKQDFCLLIGKAKELKLKHLFKKIVPIKEKKKEEALFSLYIPVDVMKKLKIMSAEKTISLKDLINTAIQEKYFE